MIDFNDKSIYERENKKLQKFLNEKLVTLSEQDSLVELDDSGGVDVIDTSSFMGGDSVDFGGDNDIWDESEINSGGKKRELDLANDRSYEQDTWWKNFLYAPLFLIFYVSKQVAYDFPDKEDWKSILQSLNKITIFSAVTGALMWVSDFVFIISGPFQTITSIIMFLTSFFILKYVYGDKKEGSTSFEDNFDFTGTPFEEDSNEDDALGYGGLNLTLDDEVSSVAVSEGEDIVVSVDRGNNRDRLPDSPIDVSKDQFFERGLLDVYASNAKYEGVEITNRKELLESFSGYIVTNDKNYGEWKIIRERSLEYNNIMYSLFKGLGQMMNHFLQDDEKMVVMDMRSNPLLFKIEVELPSYFKERQVKSSLYEIENILKANEDDTDVSVTCSYYRGVFVFKFLRLDNKNLISLGDILRFYDETKGETALEIFADDKKGLPVLLGLRENEYPYVLDLEENTSGTIVGGSGSGKSWLTFLLMFNLVLANDYNNVQFIILDKKNAPFWHQFAKFPHVLGYHTNLDIYLDLLREIYDEVDRRKALMVELGAEDVKGLREKLRRAKDYEGLKEVPLLNIVIDEITSTMEELKVKYVDSVELFNEIKGIMGKITQEGRSVGVRLILIGQRSIDSSIPKNAMMNSTFKLGMRMETDMEFEYMFGKEVNRITKPKGKGMGLARTAEEPGIYMIKTLTLGGTNNDQILKMIRVLALEWVRRSKGLDNVINPPKNVNFELSYNRDKYVVESMKEIEEGRILSHREVNRGYGERSIGEDIRRESYGGGEEYSGKYPDDETEVEEHYTEINDGAEVGNTEITSNKDSSGNSTTIYGNTDEKVDTGLYEEPKDLLTAWGEKVKKDSYSFGKVDTEESNIKELTFEEGTQDRLKEENTVTEEISEYVDDEDDDIFGEWISEELVGVSDIKDVESEMTNTQKMKNDLYDEKYRAEKEVVDEMSRYSIQEYGNTQEDEMSEGMSLEEMLKADESDTDREYEIDSGEQSRISGEIDEEIARNTVSSEEIVSNENVHLEKDETQIENTLWVNAFDGTELGTEKSIGKTTDNNEISTKDETYTRGNEDKPEKGLKEIIRNGEQPEIKSSGVVRVEHIMNGGVGIEQVNTKSIKQYVIENGEREGLLNRKMLCEELEMVYSANKIDQALDMISIVQVGKWYVAKV